MHIFLFKTKKGKSAPASQKVAQACTLHALRKGRYMHLFSRITCILTDRIGVGLRHLAVDHEEAAGPNRLGAHARPWLPRIRNVCGSHP